MLIKNGRDTTQRAQLLWLSDQAECRQWVSRTMPHTAQRCDRLLQLCSQKGRLFIEREEEMPCPQLDQHVLTPGWQYITQEWDQAHQCRSQ